MTFKSFKEYTLKDTQITHELARRGSLKHLLHKQQQEFYRRIYNTPNQFEFFLYTCRKMGKSFVLAVIGVEHCLRRKDAIVRHVFPQLNTAKETMAVIMAEVLATLPEELRPKYRRAEAKWIFPNGAQYCLGGASPENIAGLRGPYCTLLLADELCFWKESSFNECLYGTLLAQTSLIPDARLIYASTPPEQITHPSVTEIIPKLSKENAFLTYTVYDNPLITEEQIDKLIKLCGGEHTKAWRREYLCELITDDVRRVVPCFEKEEHVKELEFPDINALGVPMSYVGMVVADYGIVDGTGILGLRYDPFRSILYVEHEIFEKGDGLRWLDYTLDEVWKKLPNIENRIEIIDMFQQASKELRQEYGRVFKHPVKDKIESQIALVINAFETGRLLINPRCKILIRMLETGLWKESETVKKFERTEELLHLDLIAALCYAVKGCPWKYVSAPAEQKYKALNVFGRRR